MDNIITKMGTMNEEYESDYRKFVEIARVLAGYYLEVKDLPDPISVQMIIAIEKFKLIIVKQHKLLNKNESDIIIRNRVDIAVKKFKINCFYIF